MARILIGDTETTGFSPKRGDRMCEISLVETEDLVPTGRIFHVFLDPEHPIHWAASKVNGLTNQLLKGQPKFRDVARDMLDFIGDGELWFHNAKFDMEFLQFQLEDVGLPRLNNKVVDTIPIFKKVYPSVSGKLDDVISHQKLNTPDRKVHGALIDTCILNAALCKARGMPDLNIELLMEHGNEHLVQRKGNPPYKKKTPAREAPKAEQPQSSPKTEAPRRAAPTERRPDPRTPRAEASAPGVVRVISAAEHMDNTLVKERYTITVATLRSVFMKAGNFRQALEAMMADGVTPCPTIEDKKVVQMHFLSRGVLFSSKDLGLREGAFESGLMAYDHGRDGDLAHILMDSFRRYVVQPVQEAPDPEPEQPYMFDQRDDLFEDHHDDHPDPDAWRREMEQPKTTPADETPQVQAADTKGRPPNVLEDEDVMNAYGKPSGGLSSLLKKKKEREARKAAEEQEWQEEYGVPGVETSKTVAATQQPVASVQQAPSQRPPIGATARPAVGAVRPAVGQRREARIESMPLPENMRPHPSIAERVAGVPQGDRPKVGTRRIDPQPKAAPYERYADRPKYDSNGRDQYNSTRAQNDMMNGRPPPSAPPPGDDFEDNRITQAIEAVNGRYARVERELYRSVAMGNYRDYWSKANFREIIATSSPAIERAGLTAAFGMLGENEAMGARRWICRGLNADHALCLTVVRAGDKVPDEVRELAMRLDDGPSL